MENTTMELLNAIKKFDKAVFKKTGFVLDYEIYGRLLDYILEPTQLRYDDVIEHLAAVLTKECDHDERLALFGDFLRIMKSLKNMI